MVLIHAVCAGPGLRLTLVEGKVCVDTLVLKGRWRGCVCDCL